MMNHSCGSSLEFILDKQQDKHRVKGSPKRAPQPINLSQNVTRVTLVQRSETGIDRPYKRLLNLRNDQLYFEKGAEITVYYAHPRDLWFRCECALCRAANYPFEAERVMRNNVEAEQKQNQADDQSI